MTRRLGFLGVVLASLFGVVLVAHLSRSGTVSASASTVYANDVCQSDGSDTVTFSWQGNDPSASQQWLDVSSADNGWQQGSYVSAGPLAASVTSLPWSGYTTGEVFYVRVNQRLASGAWDPSTTYQFTTSCSDSTATPSTTATTSGTPTASATPSSCPQFSRRPGFSGTPRAGFGAGGFPPFSGTPPSGFVPGAGRPPFSGTPRAGFPTGCEPPFSGTPSVGSQPG